MTIVLSQCRDGQVLVIRGERNGKTASMTSKRAPQEEWWPGYGRVLKGRFPLPAPGPW